MSELPKHLEKREDEEAVGASHGEVKGIWRVVRNGTLITVLALGAVYAFYV